MAPAQSPCAWPGPWRFPSRETLQPLDFLAALLPRLSLGSRNGMMGFLLVCVFVEKWAFFSASFILSGNRTTCLEGGNKSLLCTVITPHKQVDGGSGLTFDITPASDRMSPPHRVRHRANETPSSRRENAECRRLLPVSPRGNRAARAGWLWVTERRALRMAGSAGVRPGSHAALCLPVPTPHSCLPGIMSWG